MSINFPLLLVIAVAVCGFLALLDLVVFAPRRRAAIANYEGQTAEPDQSTLDALNKENETGLIRLNPKNGGTT